MSTSKCAPDQPLLFLLPLNCQLIKWDVCVVMISALLAVYAF